MERRAKRTTRRGAVVAEETAVEAWEFEAPGPSHASYGRSTRQKKGQAKLIEVLKQDPEDDVVTDAASEADEITDGDFVEDDDDEDSDSDDSEEGTYFIDQTGNYYFQATPDSEPVLTTPPKGKYIPEDEDGKTGEDAGISYVLIVDDPDKAATPGEILLDTEIVEVEEDKKASVYHIGDGNNILIEEEDEEQDLDGEEEVGGGESDGPGESVILNDALQMKADLKSRRPSNRQSSTTTTTIKVKASSPDVDGDYHCSCCNYVTTKKHLLARHMKCHSEDRPFRCSVCERGFKTTASLNNHVNTHTGTKPHQCKNCDSSFTTSGELVRHVRYKHTLEKPHKCPECDYASVELSKLRRHIRCHTGERPYQCPHCTYASPDTFKLKRHLRIHTGEKPYQCDICQARFTQSNSMKAHKLIHNMGDKPQFKCDYCPTTCGRKTDLRIHIQKLHTSDTPFPCKKCHMTFQDRYTYKQHAKTHEGEKCFKCDYCDYKTVNSRHLESHILVHTDEKPYSCPSCDQSFRQKQLLKRHQNLYHNPNYVAPKPKDKFHQCPSCGKGFHHKGNLIRHMAVHDPSSSVREEAAQLKIGRKLRIDGATGYTETYEYEECEEDEEDMEEYVDEDEDIEHDDIVAVEEDDVNRFVVLEVINNEEEEITV